MRFFRAIAPTSLLALAGVASASPTLAILTGDVSTRENADTFIVRGVDLPSVGPSGDLFVIGQGDSSSNEPDGEGLFLASEDVGDRTAIRSLFHEDLPAPGTNGRTFNYGVIFVFLGLFDPNIQSGGYASLNTHGDLSVFQGVSTFGAPITFYEGIWSLNDGVISAVDVVADGGSGFLHTHLDDGSTLVTRAVEAPGSSPNAGSIGLGVRRFFPDTMTTETTIGHGSPAPDVPGAFLVLPQFDVAPSGTIAMQASLFIGSGVTAADNAGVWSIGPDTSRLVARKGDLTPSGTRDFEGFANAATNGLGDVAFVGLLNRLSTMRDTRTGIWSTRDGQLRRVAQEGFPAPGTGGLDFDSFTSDQPSLHVGGPGSLLFSGVLRGATDNDDTGFWLVNGDTIELIAREGDPAPGIDGALFADLRELPASSNDDSDFVFVARLRAAPGADPLPADARALYATNAATGELRLLVSNSGWSIDVSEAGDGSDVRTTDSSVDDSTFIYNQLNGLANNGWVTFAAVFDDATGAIFRQNLREPDAEACASDFNDDGLVDILDFGVFSSAFNATTDDAEYDARADINNDGVIDIIDFGLFGNEYNRADCP